MPTNKEDQSLDDVIESKLGDVETKLPVTDPTVASENPDSVKSKGRSIIARRRATRGGRPSSNDQEALERYREEINELRDQERSSDALINHTTDDPESDDVFKTLFRELATEIHALGFQRSQSEHEGGDISTVSNRRVQAIRQAMELWFKRQDQITSQKLDLYSLEIQVLLKFFLEKVSDALDDINLGDQKALFFNHLKSTLMGWEVEAEKKIHQALMEQALEMKAKKGV